jgi:GNAT superfamily N-acetyltransferase
MPRHSTLPTISPRPRTITLRDGARATLRPIVPEDAPVVAASFERLSEESRYRRFFTLQESLLPAQLAYLVDVDHQDHEAIIAIHPSSGDALGIARYIRSKEDREIAEVAVSVADDFQRRGLGRAPLARLVSRARREGVRRFSALVMSNNPAAVNLLSGVGETRSRCETGEVELVVVLPPQRGMGAQLAKLLRAAATESVLPAKIRPRRAHSSGGAPAHQGNPLDSLD